MFSFDLVVSFLFLPAPPPTTGLAPPRLRSGICSSTVVALLVLNGEKVRASSRSLSYSSFSSLDLDEDGVLKPLPPASPLDVRRRVFCNRSLNMKSIRAVGFDMDYTLAQYRPETFEALAYRLTVDKLVSVFGYPALIKEFEFDWRYMVRFCFCFC